MKIIKYETNFKRHLFFKEDLNIHLKEDIKSEENKIINIYPNICFQNFVGFGRSTYGSYML